MSEDTHRVARFEWRKRPWYVTLRLSDEQVFVICKAGPDDHPDHVPGGGFIRFLPQVQEEARAKPRGLCARVLRALELPVAVRPTGSTP